MKKPLLGSLVVATLLFSDASAATMYERFEAMEKEMQRLQTELADLKAEKAQRETSALSARGDDEDEDESDEEDEAEDSEDGYKEKGAASEDDEDDDEDDGEDEIDETIEDIVAELQEEVQDLTRATNGNHLKLSVDFRTAYDSVAYKMASGNVVQYGAPDPVNGISRPVIDPNTGRPVMQSVDKKQKNNSLFTNRLWLNMAFR